MSFFVRCLLFHPHGCSTDFNAQNRPSSQLQTSPESRARPGRAASINPEAYLGVPPESDFDVAGIGHDIAHGFPDDLEVFSTIFETVNTGRHGKTLLATIATCSYRILKRTFNFDLLQLIAFARSCHVNAGRGELACYALEDLHGT